MFTSCTVWDTLTFLYCSIVLHFVWTIYLTWNLVILLQISLPCTWFLNPLLTVLFVLGNVRNLREWVVVISVPESLCLSQRTAGTRRMEIFSFVFHIGIGFVACAGYLAFLFSLLTTTTFHNLTKDCLVLRRVRGLCKSASHVLCYNKAIRNDFLRKTRIMFCKLRRPRNLL